MFEALYSRPVWLGLLARASGAEIAECLRAAPALPGFTRLRRPESGMSMVRGRAGGGGGCCGRTAAGARL
ncbi:MAG TPA: phosphonate C-P lyase system protein PhnG [Acidocella sp.]|nr:phosphonate C-P lyase system protein PhnG [Acidocella sp.]